MDLIDANVLRGFNKVRIMHFFVLRKLYFYPNYLLFYILVFR